MKQYNRIMLGEHGMYIKKCLEHNYIGANFLKDVDLNETPFSKEEVWRQQMIKKYLELHPDKSVQTARNCIGFLWTVCFGLKIGDIVLASNGNGGYHVGEITGPQESNVPETAKFDRFYWHLLQHNEVCSGIRGFDKWYCSFNRSHTGAGNKGGIVQGAQPP